MNSFRSGPVAILGRPNVGKSTLLNQILKAKIAITSDVPQTTRRKLLGIYSDDTCQILFLDTPGMHKPRDLLNQYMVSQIREGLEHVDLAVILVEAHLPLGKGDIFLFDFVKDLRVPWMVAINKIDLVGPEIVAARREEIGRHAPDTPIYALSAATGEGCEALVAAIRERLPEGPQYYPVDQLSDQNERFLASEIIREQVFHLTRQEVPHSLAVTIEEWNDRDPEAGKTVIKSNIYVETESQKGILIGKSGSMLKEIGSLAREEIEKMIGRPVYLELWVKVRKKWRKNKSALQEFGYEI
jgi:GTP-binding protein Era